VHASHEALTLHSPVARPGSPRLTLLARCEYLKRHGVGEREGELGADFTSIDTPSDWLATTVAVPMGTSSINRAVCIAVKPYWIAKPRLAEKRGGFRSRSTSQSWW
jgi:hypothetical protein